MPSSVRALLQSVSPYSQSKYHNTPKLERELSHDYEVRTWRERLHYRPDGKVFIPPMSFKVCLSEAAKYRSEQVQGRGKTTYTKHFEAGIIVVEPLILPLQKEEVQPEVLFVPADGRRGSGKRVEKYFPFIAEWSGWVGYQVLDDTVTRDVFLRHLQDSGNFIGIGRFRPRNNGYYGRFTVEKLEWDKM